MRRNTLIGQYFWVDDAESDVGGEISRAGWLMFGGAAIAAVVVAVPPSGRYRYRPEQLSLYDWTTWLVVAVLAVAGLTVTGVPRHRVASAVVGLGAGAHLAGTGIVARRRWFTSAGWIGGKATNMGQLRWLAVALVVAGLVAAAAALYLVLRRSSSDRQPRGAGSIALSISVAAAVAVLVPLAMGHDRGNAKTQLIAHALMYSLP